MTFAWIVARIAAVTAVLLFGFTLLPDANVLDMGSLTIPDVIWNPLVAVLELNRVLPIQPLLVCVAVTLAIQAGMAGWWIVSWLSRHLLGGS
jgi:hypothetical protein